MRSAGFTIVELLIVIVVIAILAAITIVAYNGIQNRAYDAAIQSDLRQLGMRVQRYYLENNDTYPAATTGGIGSFNIRVSRDAYGNHYSTGSNNYNLLYCYNNTDKTFAFIANSRSGKAFAYRDGGVREVSVISTGSASTCSSLGVSSATVYWHYGQGGSNVWADWI